MRRVLPFVLWGLISVVALGGALFGYFVYSPAPDHCGGRAEADLPDLRAAGAGERRTAGSGDARLG
jgi:hypothetical protein